MLSVRREALLPASSVDPYFAMLRAREFARLDAAGVAYLDYTGSALPATRQLVAHNELLTRSVFGNPHAENAPSRMSTEALDETRSLLLTLLDADPEQYDVCFTANATAAVKLVAESYPFSPNGAYVLTADNHNSVNGVREYARRAGASIIYLPIDGSLTLIRPDEWLIRQARGTRSRLFAFPAQSNFSGVRHPLELIGAAQGLGYDVLLDAAAYLPSSALSLRTHRPEFVVLSLYKIFGYPTGLGALVARRDALARLRRPWFAGGTVEYVSIQNDMFSLLPGGGGFEDGTPNFLAAAAALGGFALLAEVGMSRLSAHVRRLTSVLTQSLRAVQHADGAPAVRVYGPADNAHRGSAVAFNVLDRRGEVIPYWIVEERARALGVALRGGCFCNPGCAEAAFGFNAEDARRCLREASANGFTLQRFAECMNRERSIAVGALRASLGLANDDRDIARAVQLAETFAEGATDALPERPA